MRRLLDIFDNVIMVAVRILLLAWAVGGTAWAVLNIIHGRR